MKTSDLEYDLPAHLIAQAPADRRDASRLLVVDRATASFREDVFSNIASHFQRGDCLVLNNTKVIKARLSARKPTGGRVELFLLKERADGAWEVLMRPAARVKPGGTVIVDDSGEPPVCAEVREILPDGRRVVQFDRDDVLSVLQACGAVPLPPYIHRESALASDEERYQTIYARTPGAVAAPTAGLHFTDEVFSDLEARGIARAETTLHVGYGTFKSIEVEELSEHRVDPEYFELHDAAAARLNETRAAGGKVCAVGTTVTRVLESRYFEGAYHAGTGDTDCYIFPPHAFGGVDHLVTNFHLPRSSLLALVCAFGGTELMLGAYRHAVGEGFRFYSYGDAMLIL